MDTRVLVDIPVFTEKLMLKIENLGKHYAPTASNQTYIFILIKKKHSNQACFTIKPRETITAKQRSVTLLL